ncbi:MAG: hypothetical protein HFI69_07770 [Lachnospiraceae bacterium]|nr:hypothetical protein [Lachnospiraceae bacterium]
MYIIQMADLHIGSSDSTIPAEKEILLKSVELIKKLIPSGEIVLICLCGDIIDSKGMNPGSDDQIKDRYEKAENLINKFKAEIKKEYNVIIKCCPGNHDATHIDDLAKFISNVDDEDSKDRLEKCYTVEIQKLETKIIFVNSCKENQHEKGCIDYDALEQELIDLGQDTKKIIVLHHTVMSMFEEDSSPIRNAAKLINLIDKYNVIGVLHGHIHGREILSLGQKQCKIIGTGALFSRNYKNVNSQFNIIELKSNIFKKILNCRYLADGGNEPWDVKDLKDSGISSIFSGNTFSNVYHQLMDTLNVMTPIYNMRMEIKSKYKEFVQDLEEFFNEDKLKIGDNEWSYFDLAKMWQADEVPEQLYFNHGSYYKMKEMSGIEYVIDILKKKPTSNRIELSTYNMENIEESLDDKNYLPSLTSIQFGKDGEKLIVHMYLRALEAKQFLKINICEIDYLLKKIKDSAITFKDVEVVISAFRVQKIDKFHCFLKAEIDAMDDTRLTTIVNYRKFSELYKLIKEKKDGQETVIKTKGLDQVYKAMKSSNAEMLASGKKEIYSKNLITLLKKVLEEYEKLDRIHKNESIQNDSGKNYEKNIDSLLGEILQSIKELEKVETS